MKKKFDKRFFIAYLSLEVIDNVKRFTARPTAAVPRAVGQAGSRGHLGGRRSLGYPRGQPFGQGAREGGGLGVCVQIIQKGPSAFEVPPNS